MTKIIREGSFFYAVNDAGYRSQMFTSASQAGRHIQRKFGERAYEVAYAQFVLDFCTK